MDLILLCIKIFCVRILDVSLGTMRTLFTVKGKTLIASVIGFFEVFIWFMIVREALQTDSTSIFVAIAYAGGYATGTLIGGFLSEKFITGNLTIQVILSNNNDDIINSIRNAGYAVSVLDVKGKDDNKYMLVMEINKNKLSIVRKLIKELDDKAFIIVNETKFVQNGYIK